MRFNEKNWKEIEADDSDYAYMNKDTGSIIFINSFCKKHDSTSLPYLVSHLFAGIEAFEIEEKLTLSLFEREAIKTKANGKLDGVKNFFLMYVVNKNRCTYDFILISKTSKIREEDASGLEKLLQGVNIP